MTKTLLDYDIDENSEVVWRKWRIKFEGCKEDPDKIDENDENDENIVRLGYWQKFASGFTKMTKLMRRP